MNKIELIKSVADRTKLPASQVEKAVGTMLSTMQSVLSAGGEVTFQGFGTFRVVERKAKNGRNPQTGENIRIPASKGVKFTAGKALKETLNPEG